ncbi:hypothetical protein [Capnocytophaga catalasegens]|uniref:hypothetical protein n=1 Tax=Capnocytophaga catalasegens TaxID=1004260 RepID=UPI00222EE068|nr:hypothetical protein [Capnocytophaga catalasegens]
MNIITNTAELICNQGTTKSKLTVTSQDFVTIEDKTPVVTTFIWTANRRLALTEQL